jgi:inner membrane protease subunit 2
MTVMGMVCIRDYFFSLDWVNGSSMAPSLSPDAHETGEQDLVLISRARPQQGLKRGDVITFWKPHKPEEISVKRVIALQGDTVYPHRGYALEKDTGKRLALMDGLPEVDEESGDREVGKVVVPYNHVWVEGDNWRMTYDSNDIGPVSMSLIDGKVLRVWRNWWFRPLQDKRKEIKTKVVESAEQMEMPALFA